ncbi:hypothetical protein [Asanoa iriomotensis]|uniref:Uncharacterized protein n=1 Tax=Asanoa iriomotensis TaxID=234613 RepID=A0ABQ4C1Y9_9ACTN|nr:hypothetical protein [Asanoa iriomotensis]GIF56790.1 hypothetical protein Air01nite_28850 [Asanoa iriomotensis]
MTRDLPERLPAGPPERRPPAPASADARTALLHAWRERSTTGRVARCIHLGNPAPPARYWLTWLPGGLYCGSCARQLAPVTRMSCDLCGRPPANPFWLDVTRALAADVRTPTTIVAMLCGACRPG